MTWLDFVHTYLDDLLIINTSTFEDHLCQLKVVLCRLTRVGLKVIVDKLSFFVPEIDYLGYLFTKDDMKPAQNKVQAVLDWQPLTTLKQVRTFLGMGHTSCPP